MKKMNKKNVIGIATVSLAAVSLIGVGFASWVVGGITDTGANGTVTATVGEVTDNRVTVTAAAKDSTLKFDSDKKGGTVFVGSGDLDDMDFSFKFTVTAKDFFQSNTLKVKLTLTGTLIELLKASATSNYLTLSTVSGHNNFTGSNFEYTQTLSHTVTDEEVKFEFGWGSFFENQNPTALTDSSKVDDYKNALAALEGTTVVGTFTAEGVAKSA